MIPHFSSHQPGKEKKRKKHFSISNIDQNEYKKKSDS